MNNYKIFNTGFLRSPVYDSERLNEALEQLEDGDFTLLSDRFLMIAVKISSNEVVSYLNSSSLKDNVKLRNTIVKYLIRMTTNTTPFGLFSGVSEISIADDCVLNREELSDAIVHSRLDFSVFFSLYSKIVSLKDVRVQSDYYLNTTIHRFSNNSIRFFRFEIDHKDKSFRPNLIHLDFDEIFDGLTNHCRYASYQDIVSYLESEGVEKANASEYVDSLIDVGFFVNDLFPSIDDVDYLETFTEKLSKLDIDNVLIQKIVLLNEKLKNIKRCSYLDVDRSFEGIEKDLKSLGVDGKNILHSDLSYALENSFLDKAMFAALPKAFSKYLNITEMGGDFIMRNFLETFKRKYGEDKIPLKIFLDRDVGINMFSSLSTYSDSNEGLFKGVSLTEKASKKRIYELPGYVSKLLSSLKGRCGFDITEFDDVNIPSNILSLGVSFSYGKEGVNSPILVKNYSLSGMTPLIGRFNYLSKHFEQFFRRSKVLEDACHSDNVELAELCHFPGTNIANVCLRKITASNRLILNSNPRDTPYYPIDDLYLQAIGDRIMLYSLSDGKRIIPKLSNAHNSLRKDQFPLYALLSIIGQQEEILFDNGHSKVLDFFGYFPRIYYKNFVLVPEMWKLNDEIKQIEENRLLEYFERNSLPKKFNLLDDKGREIFINLEQKLMRTLMSNMIKNCRDIIIREYIYNTSNNSLIYEVFLNFSK